MNREVAVKRWAARTYDLPFDDIDRVTFDVQYAGTDAAGADSLVLEIDVRMTDGHQHLVIQRICEFGRIVSEVLELAG